MSGLEVAGFVLRLIPIVEKFYYYLAKITPAALYASFECLNAILLLFIFPNAKHVVERIELHLLKAEGDEAKNVKKSLSEECTMLAVAAAIVTQVAITGLSLDDINAVHWTAKAFFITSLVTSALSIFYACLIQQKLSSLFSADDMKAWLSKPGDKEERESLDEQIRLLVSQTRPNNMRETPSDSESGSRNVERESSDFESRPRVVRGASFNFGDTFEDTARKIQRYRDNHHLKTTSFYSALMIKTPAILLNYAVAAFLIGLGIYLGFVATSGLNEPASRSDSVAVLIFYCVGTALGLLLYGVPSVLKMMEFSHVRRWETLLNGQRPQKRPQKRPPNRHNEGLPKAHQSGSMSSIDRAERGGVVVPRLLEVHQTNVDTISKGGEVARAPPCAHGSVEGSYREQQNLGMNSVSSEEFNSNLGAPREIIGSEGSTLMAALQASITAQEQTLVALRVLQNEFRETGHEAISRWSG